MRNEKYHDYYDLMDKPIGNGGCGTVYKAKIKGRDEYRAIKVINKNNIQDINNLEREIEFMKLCGSKGNENSVKFYECFNTEDEFAIVMELCDENLYNLSRKKEKSAFTSEEILNILNQLNNTFRIMVNSHICHRDLKLDNILVKYENEDKTKYKVKLTDFGISKLYKSQMTTQIGTLNMMAPEILNNKPYNDKCDLWSLGLIIFILCFNKNPFNYETTVGVSRQINLLLNNSLKRNQTKNSDLDNLIKSLLVIDPDKRLDWDGYFNHPFFINNLREKKKYRDYYEIEGELGKGGFGIVYKAKLRESGEERAIKVINKNKIRNELRKKKLGEYKEEDMNRYIDNFYDEVGYMKIMEGEKKQNKNTVKFYEYFDNEDEFVIVMELL